MWDFSLFPLFITQVIVVKLRRLHQTGNGLFIVIDYSPTYLINKYIKFFINEIINIFMLPEDEKIQLTPVIFPLFL